MDEKKYAQALNKVLGTFELVNEWADIIKFLTHLNKVVQTYKDIRDIPYKRLVAKRLSQCLNPVLPSGVHSKALDSLSLILSVVGHGQLVLELDLWSGCLFKTMQFASIQIKPQLLKIYSDFYTPLGSKLIPCLDGFVIALLPNLEELGNEFYDQSVKMMNQVRQDVGQQLFYAALFQVAVLMTRYRISVVNYLQSNFPQFKTREQMIAVFGNDLSIFVSGLSELLSDSNILVERGAMELLVNHMPLDSQLLDGQDLQKLVSCALGVVLHKEISLNRRLFTWVRPEKWSDDSEWSTLYLPIVVDGIRQHLQYEVQSIEDVQRPIKILISLLDRNDIGLPVFESMFVTLIQHGQTNLVEQCQFYLELVQICGMLFNVIEPQILFKLLLQRVMESDYQTMISFFERFDVTSQEMQEVYYPLLFLHLVKSFNYVQLDCVTCMEQLLCKISLPNCDSAYLECNNDQLDALLQGSQSTDIAILKKIVSEQFMPTTVSLLLRCLVAQLDQPEVLQRLACVTCTLLGLSEQIVCCSSSDELLDVILNNVLQSVDASSLRLYLCVLIDLIESQLRTKAIEVKICQNLEDLVLKLWLNDCFDLILRLAGACRLRLDEVIFGILSCNYDFITDNIYKFGQLWSLLDSKDSSNSIKFGWCLLFIAELLTDGEPDSKMAAEIFFKCNYKTMWKLVDPVILILLSPSNYSYCRGKIDSISNVSLFTTRNFGNFDTDVVGHVLKVWLDVLKYGGSLMVKQLCTNLIRDENLQFVAQLNIEDVNISELSYTGLLLIVLQNIIGIKDLSEMAEIHCIAVDVLQMLVQKSNDAIDLEQLQRLQQFVYDQIQSAVKESRFSIQGRLLTLLYFSMQAASRQSHKPAQSLPTSPQIPQRRHQQVIGQKNIFTLESSVKTLPRDATGPSDQSSQFLSTIVMALVTPSNSSVLPYVCDFILSALHYLKLQFRSILLPILNCLIRELEIMCQADAISIQETRFYLLTHCIQKVISFCQTEAVWEILGERQVQSPSSYGLKGITDMMSGVFSTEVSSEDSYSPHHKVRESLALAVFQTSSIIARRLSLFAIDASQQSQSHLRIKQAANQILDSFLKPFPLDLLEASCKVYAELLQSDKSAFPVYETLAQLDSFDARVAMAGLYELMKETLGGDNSQRPKIWRSIGLERPAADLVVLSQFASGLIRFVDQPSLLLSLWNDMQQFMRESQSMSSKYQYIDLSRLLSAYQRRMKELCGSLEDQADYKNIKKQVADVHLKVLDSLVQQMGKLKNSVSKPLGDDVTVASSSSKASLSAGNTEVDPLRYALDIMLHFTSAILLTDDFSIFLPDAEKQTQLFVNIAYYILSNYLRHPVLELRVQCRHLLFQLAKQLNSYKSWRKEAWDCFLNPHFLPMDESPYMDWLVIMGIVFANERERIDELLSQLSASQSGLFASRDNEISNRCSILKRISFALFSREVDYFLVSWPGIQEKLADIFKTPYRQLHSEAYQCLCIVFMKISPKSLVGFWPIVIDELSRLVETVILSQMSELTPEICVELYHALRFMEIVLFMSSDEFQVHRWLILENGVSGSEQVVSLVGKLFVKFCTESTGVADHDLNLDADKKMRKQTPVQMKLGVSSAKVKSIQDLVPVITLMQNSINLQVISASFNCYQAFNGRSHLSDLYKSNQSTLQYNFNPKSVDIKAIEECVKLNYIDQ
ncbi:hypothetical protein MP228_009044 [Amoeboaphelidium protococcarum]|nr:hypothetical protein MP228_009044 [Amoeboaphelidium protococcarum]